VGRKGQDVASRTRVPALVAAAVLLGASPQAASTAAPTVAQVPQHWDASAAPEPTPGDGFHPRGLLLTHDELLALPTQGDAWQAIVSRVEDPRGGGYRLGARDESNTDVLAHALAGARLDDDRLKGFVRDKIARVISLPRPKDDILAALRNLQTYIISADLIDLATFDPALDAEFRRWLGSEIRARYTGGGGGGSVVSVHRTKVNNFGTHAGATRLAAALYLGDEAEFRAARDVWQGWTTGDPAYVPDGLLWSGTDWQCDLERPRGINPPGCTRDGHSLDGVLPEDQRRCGEYAWPPCRTTYVHGAADGLLLSFWMLARHGETPWEWGDQAALRQMRWKYEVGQPPDEGFRWQIPVIEAAYGIDLAGNDPTATSTNFGFADWWTGSAPPPDDPSSPRWADRTPTPPSPLSPSAVPTAVSIGLGVLGILVTSLVAIRWHRRRPGWHRRRPGRRR
jgi:Alginate lyase